MTTKIRLTAAMRTEFVNNVLRDIKTEVDNDAIRKMVMVEALAELPPAVLKLWNDEATKPYVQTHYVSFSAVYLPIGPYQPREFVQASSVYHPGLPTFKVSKKVSDKVAAMLQAVADKKVEKKAISERLTAMARSCVYAGDLEEMFPLLTKYIPKAAAKVTEHVPAVLIKDTMAQLRKLGVPEKKQAVPA